MVFGIGDPWMLLEMQRRYSQPWPWSQYPRQCACTGGPDCCATRAEREREAAIRADERAKVLRELGQSR